MERAPALKRKSFFMEEATLQRAKKLLGVATDAEAVRLSLQRVTEMEGFWRQMRATRKSLPRKSFDET